MVYWLWSFFFFAVSRKNGGVKEQRELVLSEKADCVREQGELAVSKGKLAVSERRESCSCPKRLTVSGKAGRAEEGWRGLNRALVVV